MTAANSTWHVVGAGSIGCLFAAYLRLAGRDVQLILRDDASVAQLRQCGGIVLERAARCTPIAVAAATAAALTQPLRNLLICTKVQHTLAALHAIKSQLAPAPLLILLQNGMGVREAILQAIPDAVVLHAVTTQGAYRRARFHVVHAGGGDTFLGAIEASQQPVADAAAQALRCDLPIAAVADIDRRLWQKLAINSVINPLTALHRCRNGELLEIPHAERLIEQLCAEFIAVARAEHKIFSADSLREDIRRVSRDTAANQSSMLQDVLARRRTEIDFINGFILDRAARHGIACPQHLALFNAIAQIEGSPA